MSARALLVLALVPYGLWLVFAYRYHFLDGANLLFHEAGHVFFGLFGRTLGVLGGTLGQLVFPIAAAAHFLRRSRPFEAAVCAFWLCESLMYVALYMGDSNRLELPLVNDGLHDWRWLLGGVGLLAHAEWLAAALHGVASLGLVAAWGWALRAVLEPDPAGDAAPRAREGRGRSTGGVAEASSPGVPGVAEASPRSGL
jgi:hypothetical protein